MAGDKANITSPAGLAALRAEYDALLGGERPKLVEVISWAAGNGDRSENGDYIYGRKRLREIDRRLSFLARRMQAARVVDPAEQPDKSRIWFGATAELAGDGRIGWNSTLARALRGAGVGDLRTVQLPAGPKEWEIIAVRYP